MDFTYTRSSSWKYINILIFQYKATGEPELQQLVITIHRFKKWMAAAVRALWRHGYAVNWS
jgi:hypothetical protein